MVKSKKKWNCQYGLLYQHIEILYCLSTLQFYLFFSLILCWLTVMQRISLLFSQLFFVRFCFCLCVYVDCGGLLLFFWAFSFRFGFVRGRGEEEKAIFLLILVDGIGNITSYVQVFCFDSKEQFGKKWKKRVEDDEERKNKTHHLKRNKPNQTKNVYWYICVRDLPYFRFFIFFFFLLFDSVHK